ncbi:MAG: serine/threonine-protein kinase [Gaiellaceae bacterium]
MRSVIDDRYRLEKKLGVGAMAEVWLAHDDELGRPVALKLVNASADPGRFEREARAVAALSHSNICQLYDCGTAEGRAFMVLEYLPDGTLEDRLPSGRPLPDDEARRISAELAAGLAHAHARGIVHRDLKPANVLFDHEGRLKIADFGIAAIAGERTLTADGTVLGTAAYISPEQVNADSATPASDVYSFGVILYRMLTGRLPFEAESAVELAEKHVREEPPAIETLRPDAPPDLARLAEAALAKRPEERPADGAALVDGIGALETATSETTALAAAPTQAIRRMGPWPVGRLVAGVAALVALAAAGVAVALLTTTGTPGRGTPAQTHSRARNRSQSTGGATTGVVGTTRSTQTSSTRHTTTAAPTTAPTSTTPTTAPSTTAPATTTTTTSTTASTGTTTTIP